MSSTGFVPSSTFVAKAPVRGITVDSAPRCPTQLERARYPGRPRRSVIQASGSSGDKKGEKKGLFGRLKDSVLRSVVTVPGGGKPGADLLECVFCKGSGVNDCDACQGAGTDALGTCLMCDGKTYLTCTVCNGVGTVDRIRRGGTDDHNDYVVKKKRRN